MRRIARAFFDRSWKRAAILIVFATLLALAAGPLARLPLVLK